ncbi:hypothetical protein O181_006657 [Austropuccinia psidii MF-1]|uniref:Uncharacterized protein n=1 Tax=Austropuccinia psidii MF-1 TaxID=1389203 RepID=A0A9Q3BKF5_9BASI|nr:hypothetical protein [Austropuccinia psidii MF-1]
MTIVNRAGNIYKNGDDLSRWALPNTLEPPDYVPENADTQIPNDGINITDVGTEFFEEIRENYKQYKNSHLLTSLLDKYFKDSALANTLDDIWKTSYENGRFHLFDSTLYHRSKHTCVRVLFIRMLICTILLEFNDKIYPVHMC